MQSYRNTLKNQVREALLTLFQSVVLGQKVESKREIPLEVYIKENVPFQGTEKKSKKRSEKAIFFVDRLKIVIYYKIIESVR